MMEKLAKPRLRFSEFTEKWNNEVISNISDKITDGTHDTPKPIKEGIPFLTAIHVKNGNIDFKNCYYLTKEEHDKIYKRCNPQFGDLLMVNIGAGTATSAMVNVDYEFSLKNVALIKPNKRKINPSFFAQIQRRNSDRIRHQISSGGAQPFLSLKAIAKLKLIIPSVPEQQKIASFLTDVDLKITQLTKKKALLENYKKGIMQQIFSQEIRFKDDDGEAFPDWVEKKLDTLSSLITKGTTPTSLGFSYLKEGVNFIKVECITKSGFINIESTPKVSEQCNLVLKRSELKVNDILFSIAGTLGRTAIVKEKDVPANTNQALSIIRLKTGVNLDFINYSLNTIFIEKYIFKMVSVGAQPNLNLQQVGNIKIGIPIISEQTKIANFLSDIDTKIEVLTSTIVKAQTFKKGLLQQMFV